MARSYALESVDRVMKVLDCFTLDRPELRLTDLSNELGLHKAQILRIASTLEAGGYLTRDPESKRFRLGMRLFHLGIVVRQQMDLRRIANPFLKKLAEETGETARLVIPDEGGPICIDIVESRRRVRVYAQVGTRLPWNAGSSAKVILSYLPDEMRERILQHAELPKFTALTTTAPDVLRAELTDIRARGYHVNVADLVEDTGGIAAPVFKDTGEIACAISMVAPASRMQTEQIERHSRVVIDIAAEISRHLGFLP